MLKPPQIIKNMARPIECPYMPGIIVNTRPWNLQVSVQDFKKMSPGVVHWISSKYYPTLSKSIHGIPSKTIAFC